MTIMKAAIDTIRVVAEPFLGEGMSGAQLAACETNCTQALAELVKAKVLVSFAFSVTATALERTQGRAKAILRIVPAFELRELATEASLSAS
jgi:hypothetical protein